MAKLYVNPGRKLGKINKEIYGNFSEHLGRCIYEGLYVGENSEIPNVNGMRKDVVKALREMKLPVLRWPGGCFADEYHWEDGIGPKENRKRMINTHWGGVLEDNSFGTHEFMELCKQIGCDSYVNANVGSGSVREMSEWVEYMTFDGVSPMADKRRENGHEEPFTVNYLGVGNENWGCGGNMTADYYADEYRRYQTYVRFYPSAKDKDKKPIYKIACGPNGDDYDWTDTLMKKAGRFMNGLSLHYYTITHDWVHKGSATEFTTEEYFKTLSAAARMEELLDRHSAIMDRYDPEKKVGLIVDEWGTWFDVEPGTNPGFLYQQNTMRDAMVASLTLNLFNKRCSRVKMANIAQLINVLQSVILTEGEKMILTPTYFVFKMFAAHQEAELIDSGLNKEYLTEAKGKVQKVYESASVAEDGTVSVTLTNTSLSEAEPMELLVTDKTVTSAKGEILTGAMADHNTFDKPKKVKTATLKDITVADGTVSFTLPPCSVVVLKIKTAK